ncbi:Het-C-domain-containing protein [Laetiporus sulphureus 93-53]|uniref:Het-C-domain-containing protein n=1 Tax=Laetiporus sulphureus 93-53 TaxID=1314785 RepID=A0A165DAW7_9APHY|nr:Het-C-domain-containing protein [Laetiporus sulphureus 93-53]KZT04457.1 Het-C-domain-containing protein [Laetiporus sulphureus 93-53]
MPSNAHILLIFLCVLVFCLQGHGAYAFGAGNIPSYAYLEGKAFRHGDIEDSLADIAKRAGGFALGALIGRGGTKFKALDVKRVYFGNWLRDYSQAVDVAGLSKLQLATIINLCMVLGFMAHGYATEEFEVTAERLGVYLPTEHIDNPKGYPENARDYDRRLRGPVDPQELAIDPRTGMKNYIANEFGTWDTSKALVRRTLHKCIEYGRRYRSNGNKEDEYESYRLLGQALHTVEDFAAHSNFCELALVSLGYRDVFVHVGDQVRLQAPDGRYVAPLVTGTFGSSDFMHSLLGEATDHISQASVVDLNAELDKARAKSASFSSRSFSGEDSSNATAGVLRSLLEKLPDGSGGEMERQMDGVQRLRAQNTLAPEDMSPQQLHDVLWQVLSFRDSVMKKVSIIIDKIPGLGSLLESISDSISVFVFTTLEPFLKPIMQQATTGLMTASGEVIKKTDQYEVFNNPNASDPTHSFLSKDHFNLILNEPAGNLGKIILEYTVPRIVKAWEDTSINVNQVTDDVLHCLFHPDFHDSDSPIQRQMVKYMQTWVQGLENDQAEIIRRLSKESVRNHKNIRIGSEEQEAASQGSFAQAAGMQMQSELLHDVPGMAQAQSLLGKTGGAATSAGIAGSRPGFGLGAGAAGAAMVGLGGVSRSGMPDVPEGGYYSEGRSQNPYRAPEESSDGDRQERHGHHHRLSQGTGGYYAESASVQMPSGEAELYNRAASAGYPGAAYTSSRYEREPPNAPLSGPPGFPGAAPTSSGYSPSYVGGYSGQQPQPSFPDPMRSSGFGDGAFGDSARQYGGYREREEGMGLGEFSPPPGPPPGPGGPEFPEPHHHRRHHQHHDEYQPPEGPPYGGGW